MVATLVRTIFEQPDHDSVWAQHARVVDQLTGRFDDAANMLADAAEDLLAFSTFPVEHWSAVRSNNPRSASTRSCAGAPTWWGYSPTAPLLCAWSVPCCPSKTMSGQWPSVTWAQKAWPKRGCGRSRARPSAGQKSPSYKLQGPPKALTHDNQIPAWQLDSSTRPKCSSVVTALTFATLSAYSFQQEVEVGGRHTPLPWSAPRDQEGAISSK
jgi:hypothetical protein